MMFWHNWIDTLNQQNVFGVLSSFQKSSLQCMFKLFNSVISVLHCKHCCKEENIFFLCLEAFPLSAAINYKVYVPCSICIRFKRNCVYLKHVGTVSDRDWLKAWLMASAWSQTNLKQWLEKTSTGLKPSFWSQIVIWMWGIMLANA